MFEYSEIFKGLIEILKDLLGLLKGLLEFFLYTFIFMKSKKYFPKNKDSILMKDGDKAVSIPKDNLPLTFKKGNTNKFTNQESYSFKDGYNENELTNLHLEIKNINKQIIQLQSKSEDKKPYSRFDYFTDSVMEKESFKELKKRFSQWRLFMENKNDQQLRKKRMKTEEKEEKVDMKTFDNFDKIGLKTFAEKLTNLIEERFNQFENENFNISLHAKFGWGKTTFLEMWKNYLREQKFKVIEINVWDSDFYKDPALSFLYSFLEGLDKEGLDKGGKIKQAFSPLMKSVLFQTAKNLTTIDFKEMLKDAKEEVASSESDLFDELKKIKNVLKALKDSLKGIEYEKFPIIVLVDELDRCRPNYTVDILEIMKHFFHNPNIVFVCAVNKDQIKSTVENMFGDGIEFEGYYKKFFKYETKLPSIKDKLEKFVGSKLEHFNKGKNQYEITKGRVYFASHVLSVLKFSLREVDQLMIDFNKSFKSIYKKNIPYGVVDLSFFTTALNLKQPELCENFFNDKISTEKMLSEIKNLGFFEKINIWHEDMAYRHILSFFHEGSVPHETLNSFMKEHTSLKPAEIQTFVKKDIHEEYKRLDMLVLRYKKTAPFKIAYKSNMKEEDSLE